MKKGSVETVRLRPEHLPEYAEFVRKIWDPSATADDLKADAVEADGEGGRPSLTDELTYICLSEGRVVGQVLAIPVRLVYRGAESVAHWIKGLWVLPELRNGVVGFLIMREVTDKLDGPLLVLTVRAEVRRLLGATGFEDLGEVPNLVRPLNSPRILGEMPLSVLDNVGLPDAVRSGLDLARKTGLVRPAAWGFQKLVDAWGGLHGGGTDCFDVRFSERVGIEPCDALWKRVRGQLTASPVRDGSYLKERYELGDPGRYTFVEGLRDSELAAFASLRIPADDEDDRLRGLRVVSLSEVVFPPEEKGLGLALLEGVVRRSRALNADGVFCSSSNRALLRLLGRQGFVRVGGNMHFLFRPGMLDGDDGPGAPLSDWWICRGDGFSDASF